MSVMRFFPTKLLPLAVFAFALLLYLPTMAPDVLWGGGDFATFQVKAYLLELQSGIFGHPLWVILAHPFTKLPIGNIAWRANFAAVIFAALALVIVFLISRHLTRSTPASLLATAALAVSHTFWTYAVMPKVYSLNALLLAATIHLVLLWRSKGQSIYLWLFAFLYGLSLLNHLVMATAAAGFLVYVIAVSLSNREKREPLKELAPAAGFFFLGLFPFLFLEQSRGSSEGTLDTITTFLRGLEHLFVQPLSLALGISVGFALLVYQFPVAFLIGFWGLYLQWKESRSEALLLGLIALGDTLFLLAATDPRTGGEYWWNLHYYLQVYVVFAVWIAYGVSKAWRSVSASIPRILLSVASFILLPILLYAVTPALASRILSDVPGFRPLPGRDNFAYVLSPWKHQETGARQFGETILKALPPGSVLFADYSIWAVLRYLVIVEGARPDITLVELSGDQLALILEYEKKQPQADLFLADTYRYYDLERIQQFYELRPFGPVYQLVRKNG